MNEYKGNVFEGKGNEGKVCAVVSSGCFGDVSVCGTDWGNVLPM